jgi:hypothetical protein
MSNISVPHPFRVFCEMGGKPQTLGVRAFPPLRQKKVARIGHGSSLAMLGAPGLVFETWETTNPTPHSSAEAPL